MQNERVVHTVDPYVRFRYRERKDLHDQKAINLRLSYVCVGSDPDACYPPCSNPVMLSVLILLYIN